MKVKVEVFGPARDHLQAYDPDRGLVVDLPPDARVQDLLARLNIPQAESGMVTVNLQMAEPEDEIPAGASVVILPFAGGG